MLRTCCGSAGVRRQGTVIKTVKATAPPVADASICVPQHWATWNRNGERRFTVGVEDEAMLLAQSDYSLAQSGDAVLARLSGELRARTAPETHAAVIELTTGIHAQVGPAVAELGALRAQLTRELDTMGLHAASAGTYPLAGPDEIEVSRAARYGLVAATMRGLARRQPTMALHVHVGVPDPEDAITLLNALREVVPASLALSANSPFCDGRDTGFASARTMIFQAFPRTGSPRRFESFAHYIDVVEPLVASGALPGPSFLWWDVRLQPDLGTVEVRAMDAQSTARDAAPLVALVQSFAKLVLQDEFADGGTSPEVLAENRFLAARDGLEARLIDPLTRRMVPTRMVIEALVQRCLPHADALGCGAEVEQVERLAVANGADRQRMRARAVGLEELVSILSKRFS